VADFSWQFNDTFGDMTQEMTTPTITHTFPSQGAYSIGLTVFNPNGLSTGTGGIITTGQNGLTPEFTFSPNSPTIGQPVTFSALSNVSAQPVTTYLWEFGDGTTGSGATPTHVYKKAGTYTVKAVLFSGVGSAFPGAGAAPLATEQIKVN
jgi:PKD repeat protein